MNMMKISYVFIILLCVIFLFCKNKPYPFKICDTSGNPVFRTTSVEVIPDVIRPGVVMTTSCNQISNEIVRGGVNTNEVYYLGIRIQNEVILQLLLFSLLLRYFFLFLFYL